MSEETFGITHGRAKKFEKEGAPIFCFRFTENIDKDQKKVTPAAPPGYAPVLHYLSHCLISVERHIKLVAEAFAQDAGFDKGERVI